MSCQYAASNCAGHTLPMTGLEIGTLLFLAILAVTFGLAVRVRHGR